MVVFFILLISIPVFTKLAPPEKFWQQFPSSPIEFSIRNAFKNALAFPQSYNQYFNDHYLFHTEQVNAFHAFRFHVLNEKQYPNLLIGDENWLYYTGENNIKDFECTSRFTKNELDSLVDVLTEWDDRLRSQGIKLYILIAPNKETIYPQYLPEFIKPGWGICRIDQVIKAVSETQLRVLDVRPALLAAADNTLLYHRTDTHWNDTGALTAAIELLKLIRADFPQTALPAFEQYQQIPREFSGDLAGFIPRDNRFIEDATFLRLDPQDGFVIVEGEGRTILSRNQDRDLPSAIVFRDSFADALIPFLAPHFSTAVYVHAFNVNFETIEKEKPDIVIFEIAQRYLTVLR